jgi:hypothetical protein
LSQIQQGLPDPDPRCREMPEAIERVIRAGLAREPNQRPGLKDFVETLRASLNQLLADTLVPTVESTRPLPVNLKLMVSREARPGTYEPATTTRPKTVGLTRDMKKVPRQPEQASLRTGDRVRIEVVADKPGYITVFNVGPTGTLNLLYPDDALETEPALQEASQPLHVLEVEMTPPTGRERLFAIWSRDPRVIPPENLHSVAGHETSSSSRPYHSTRDMVRIRQSTQSFKKDDWHAVSLELDHHG